MKHIYILFFTSQELKFLSIIQFLELEIKIIELKVVSKKIEKSSNYLCTTHPHQIYLEFLSEHGLLGTLILLSILFYLIFKNYKKMIIKKNLIQLGCFCYLLTNFIPLLPGVHFLLILMLLSFG